MAIPRLKRVPIDWDQLYECIIRQGFTIYSLSKKISTQPNVFYAAKRDKKMNPLIVVEIDKYVAFDIDSVMKEPKMERIRNGRSTSGRIGTDWLYLERELDRKGYSLKWLSLKLGRSGGYLNSCKREGGLYEDTMIRIGEILNIDFHNLIKVTSYDKLLLRYDVVDMVNNQEYPEIKKGTEINDLYQGNSPQWRKLKEVMLGEVSSYIIRDDETISESNYDQAEKHKPNLESFSMYDVAHCSSINDLPEDWRHLAFACMKKYGLPPFAGQKDLVP